MKAIIFSFIAIVLISLVAGGLAYPTISMDDSENFVMSPQGNFDRYENGTEGELLSFYNKFNQSENPNCPCNLTIIPDQYTLNYSLHGARMKTNTTFNGWGYGEHPGYPMPAWVFSFFNWTPNYCQSSPELKFNVSQYKQQMGQDSAGLSNIFMYHVNITNTNRLPAITSYVPEIRYISIGQSWNLQLKASDIDKTECGDDEVHWTSFTNYTGGKTFTDYGNGTAQFSIGPVNTSNIGSYQLTFTAYDNFNGTSNKTVNLVIYQPYNRPSCYYNKKLGGYVCA
jgi:hypothetical protein